VPAAPALPAKASHGLRYPTRQSLHASHPAFAVSDRALTSCVACFATGSDCCDRSYNTGSLAFLPDWRPTVWLDHSYAPVDSDDIFLILSLTLSSYADPGHRVTVRSIRTSSDDRFLLLSLTISSYADPGHRVTVRSIRTSSDDILLILSLTLSSYADPGHRVTVRSIRTSSDDIFLILSLTLSSYTDPGHRVTVRSIRTSSDDGARIQCHCFPAGLDRSLLSSRTLGPRFPLGLELSALQQDMTSRRATALPRTTTPYADSGHRVTVRGLTSRGLLHHRSHRLRSDSEPR